MTDVLISLIVEVIHCSVYALVKTYHTVHLKHARLTVCNTDSISPSSCFQRKSFALKGNEETG